MKKTALAMLAAGFASFSLSAFADIAVIVNPANTSEMSKKDVANYFLGKKNSFANGTSVTPFSLSTADQDIRNKFYMKVTRKNSSQFNGYWSQMTLQGKGRPPKELDSQDAMKQTIASNEGAIGFIDAANADDSVRIVYTVPN